jgi:uncharacterized protein YecT (DUF1311 family)
MLCRTIKGPIAMKVFTLVVLLCFAAVAHAGGVEWYGTEYARCRDQPTSGIVSCVADLTKTWDNRLNRAYKTVMARQDASRKTALRDVQRLWIKYRDANCGFYAEGPGSISQVTAAECLRFMTKQRALELEQQLRP